MARYEVHELRRLAYTLEVPDSVMPGDVQAAGLDSANLWARGSGGIIAESSAGELVSYTVHPSEDDTEPADVQLDEKLRDRSPPES